MVTNSIPKLTIKELKISEESEKTLIFLPPEDDCERIAGDGNYVSAISFSTYPVRRGRDMSGCICDSICINYMEDMFLAVIADGCNWGNGPRNASRTASKSFMEKFKENMHAISDSRDVAYLMLNCIEYAHNQIIEQSPDSLDTGTTTILGVTALPVLDHQTPYVVICACLGDCKACIYKSNQSKLVEITWGTRTNLNSTTDCGGRIGPYLENKNPDLRNLSLFLANVESGDYVIILTDGVHDNFDPEFLGLLPSEFGLTFSTWEECPTDDLQFVKSSYFIKQLKKKMNNCSNPHEFIINIYDHCNKITSAGRTWMQEHPNQSCPEDYKLYPGKMDHSTVGIMKIPQLEDQTKIVMEYSTVNSIRNSFIPEAPKEAFTIPRIV